MCLVAGAPLGRLVVLRCSVLHSVLWGVPPSNPVSCLTVVFCARCGLTSSRAYVFSGGCSAVVLGRFCVGLSSRPAALRSAAFALKRARSRPRPTAAAAAAFPAVGRSFQPCLLNKCLMLSGALPPLTPARVAPAGGRCFSWYLCGLWPCSGNFAPVLVTHSPGLGATAKPQAW